MGHYVDEGICEQHGEWYAKHARCPGCEDAKEAELARLRAEVEKLRTMVDTMTQTNDEMHALYEERGAEVEKLQADIVWAVRKCVGAVERSTGMMITPTQEFDEEVVFDGTDASLLSALRRAREGQS